MKRLIHWFLVFLLLVSCSGDKILFDGSEWIPLLEPRYIHIKDSIITLQATPAPFETYIESMSTPWQFSGQASWLTINPQKGTENAKVTISATENMSGENLRTSIFLFSSAVPDYNHKSRVSVLQRASDPYLQLSESSLTLAAVGDTKVINVNKNISYTISKSSSASWLSITASEDYTKLTITAAPNPTAYTRSASITLSGLRTQVINLTQEAAGMTSNIDGRLDVGVKGGNYAMQIVSDAAWTASTNGSWYTVSPSEGKAGTTQVILSVSPNNTTSTRRGQVDFKIGSKGILNINFSQEELYCRVNSSRFSIGAVGGSDTIKVYSNTEWTVISKPSWIATDVESGTGDGQIEVSVLEHIGSETRTGVIEVGVEGVTSLVHSIHVTQSQHYLKLSPASFASLPSTGGTHRVVVASDDKWKASKEETWLTLSADEGVGDMDVVMTATNHPSIKERSAKVIFTPTYAAPIEFDIKQSGRYLSVDATRVLFYWRGGISQPVAITTDGTFLVTTQSEWLKIEQNGHSFTLTAEKYDAKEPRSAIVTVSLTDLADNEMYNINIPVVQRGNVPIDIITFPQDQYWDVGGNTHTSVSIIGYAIDELWDNFGDSSLGLNIVTFGKDENWNH
ncbi:MAG: BACON domain-containing protein [Bacteroidaceae bacterium]|nr:BACON domain-containing protein [Bacteroidaceae bacterium]